MLTKELRLPPCALLPFRARVDLDHPDYEKYPDARLLRPLDVVMGPGDMLVVPRWPAVPGVGMNVTC